MNYCEIKDCDIANGYGIRITLFVSGCTNHCKGCFQPETWSFEYGQPFTREIEDRLITMLRPDYVDGLTLLGGDPFEPRNQAALLPFLHRVRKEAPGKSIWAYSGFLYENMLKEGTYVHCETTEEMLSLIDVLVDGPFVEELKKITLQFKGSENQRIIDLNETRSRGEIVIWKDPSRP